MAVSLVLAVITVKSFKVPMAQSKMAKRRLQYYPCPSLHPHIHGLVLLHVVFTLILDSRSTLLVLFVSLSSLPFPETRFGIGAPFSALPPFFSIPVPKSQFPCNGFHQ
ncbi:hypothetical protein IWW34DRAFT_149593 [Fusarium oxysporum f. sp. albedinis]|nr:hypothetical protein IWW34DRAFT_149593 [Fusarium oxysporum f. sp. albedinis]